MKTELRKVLALFVIMLSVGLVTSCSSDDDVKGDAKTFVGTWVIISERAYTNCDGDITNHWSYEYDVEDREEQVTFHKNGKFTNEYGDTGKWSYNNGKLTITWDEDDEDDDEIEDYTDVFEITGLTSSSFTMTYIDDESDGCKYFMTENRVKI